METCSCDRCMGTEQVNAAYYRIVTLHKSAERLVFRLYSLSNWCSKVAFGTVGVMILVYLWHVLCQLVGWHNPADRLWVHSAVLLTLVTSSGAASLADHLSRRMHNIIDRLKPSINDLGHARSIIVRKQRDIQQQSYLH